VVGAVGEGWPGARMTLAHERRFSSMWGGPSASGPGRVVKEARAEAAENYAPYVWYPQRAGRADLLIERARANGLAGDPVIRQEIARVLSLQKASAWTAERARVARETGRPPGAEGSIGKLAASQLARAAAKAHALIARSSGMLSGEDAPLNGVVTEVLISVPAVSIAGGTDEIQHNILAENVLGLPREPGPGRNVPFRETLRNT
jgi:alkylation response protein AidB-like acyl-CoA dehydrogenase